MQNTPKSTGKNQKKGSLKGIGAPRALQIIVSELAQIFSWVKPTILNGKFSPVRSIIVPKKVEITMDNWMQYYEVSPCNSSIDYNAFGEIESLDHQHTLQLKNNYILHP